MNSYYGYSKSKVSAVLAVPFNYSFIRFLCQFKIIFYVNSDIHVFLHKRISGAAVIIIEINLRRPPMKLSVHEIIIVKTLERFLLKGDQSQPSAQIGMYRAKRMNCWFPTWTININVMQCWKVYCCFFCYKLSKKMFLYTNQQFIVLYSCRYGIIRTPVNISFPYFANPNISRLGCQSCNSNCAPRFKNV